MFDVVSTLWRRGCRRCRMGRLHRRRRRWSLTDRLFIYKLKDKKEILTFVRDNRFSRSTSSTLRLRLRPVSTSSRYVATYPEHTTHSVHQGPKTDSIFSSRNRPLCPSLALSSWTSSAPAASPSPPSSRTPRPLSSAPVARPFSASPPVVRLV